MNREYHKRYSYDLQRDMETLVFGHAGVPTLVFPTSTGRFHDYEDRGMIEVLAHKLEMGELQALCVDSVDGESWHNQGVHPRARVLRHLQYDRYISQDVIPWIRSRNSSSPLTLTGCDFGGYHAVNFSLRHPDLVTRCVSMGGIFGIHRFLDGYYDDNCYFNCPQDFLPDLSDDWDLPHFRNNLTFVLVVGERDLCLDENLKLARLMEAKHIPVGLDVWGNQAGHDWPWWQQMAVKYF
jgi:esterase/lipase superfamily enzyme